MLLQKAYEILEHVQFLKKHVKRRNLITVGGKNLEKQLAGLPLQITHLCTNLMHDMTKFMEVSPHLIMPQERGTTC